MEKTRFLQKIVKNQNLPVDIWGSFQFQVETSKKACAKFQFDTTISYACYFSAKKRKFGIKIGGTPLEVYPRINFLLVFLAVFSLFLQLSRAKIITRGHHEGVTATQAPHHPFWIKMRKSEKYQILMKKTSFQIHTLPQINSNKETQYSYNFILLISSISKDYRKLFLSINQLILNKSS